MPSPSLHPLCANRPFLSHVTEQRHHILHSNLGRATLFRAEILNRLGLVPCNSRGTRLGRAPSVEPRLAIGAKQVGLGCLTLAEMQDVVSLVRYVSLKKAPQGPLSLTEAFACVMPVMAWEADSFNSYTPLV